MIIIEGSDGAGKTTLVKHLAEKFRLEVGKRGTANRDDLYKVTRQDTYTHLALAVRASEPPKVLDRLFISEFVYSPMMGRPCEFSRYERTFIREIMDTLHCPVIRCLPPYEVVAENCAKAHQMRGVNENLREIYDHYDYGLLPWPDNTISYDYTGQRDFADLAAVEAEVEGYITEREKRQAWH